MKQRSFLWFSLACGVWTAACAPDTDQAPAQATGPSTGAPGGLAGTAAPAAPRAGSPAAVGGAVLPGTAGTTAPPLLGAAGARAMVGVGAAGMAGLPRAGMSGTALPGAGAAGRGPAGPTGAAGKAGPTMAAAGSGGAPAGASGTTGTGGACGDGTATDGRPTSGPLACIVEQHNAVRAMVKAATPLPPVTWSAEIAKYAQEWTDMTCMNPMHRMRPSLNGKPLGENLYASGGVGDTMPGKNAVDGWGGEVACYTYGAFMTGDKCDMSCTSKMNSDGCGHYTQVVWRDSIQIGCGVTTCGSGFQMRTEVICNYAPAGNYVGMMPY